MEIGILQVNPLVGSAVACLIWLWAVKCFDASKNLLYISFTGLITGLDVLTDILSRSTRVTRRLLPVFSF